MENNERTIRNSKVTELTRLFTQQQVGRTSFFEEVKSKLIIWMDLPNSPVHFVRWRKEKSPASLKNKIENLFDNNPNLTPEEIISNYWIPDISACRILVLYRDDIPLVHEAIMSERQWQLPTILSNHNPYAKILKSRLFVDKGRFNRIGISLLNQENYEKPNEEIMFRDDGYESIHYVLQAEKGTPYEICELQVRTVQQEAWSEFSHDIKYPESLKQLDQLPSNIIKRISELNHLSEDLIDEIRRFPMQSGASDLICDLSMNAGEVLTPDFAVNVITEKILPKTRYLYRSAPFSVFGLLNPTTDSDKNFGKLNDDAVEVISLDPSINRKLWNKNTSYDSNVVITKAYLEVHKKWKNAKPNRSVSKYFVLSDESPEKLETFVSNYAEDIDIYIIPGSVHEAMTRKMNSHMRWESVIQNPLSWQFFTWLNGSGGFSEANLNFFDAPHGGSGYGFYTPDPEADLLTSICWVKPDGGFPDAPAASGRLKPCIDLLRAATTKGAGADNQVIFDIKDWNDGARLEATATQIEAVISDCIGQIFAPAS